MEQQQFDVQELMVRLSAVAKELRKSEAYPAIIGGVAGGIAGALMAVIIAGALASKRQVAPAASEDGAKKTDRPPMSVRDALQLLTVIASLAKQVQELSKERTQS